MTDIVVPVRRGARSGLGPESARYDNPFGTPRPSATMADDTSEENDAPAEESADGTDAESESDDESQSFRERVEEIRQQRAEEGDGDGEGMSREERMEEMMGGGGGPPGMGGGGGGGNPFAQMMGGMMGGGGGPPGMGGGPGGPGGRGEEESSSKADEELVREVRKLRDEVHDARRELGRIADALED